MNAIDVTGAMSEIEAILKLAHEHDGVEDVSAPIILDASKALNAGLTMQEVGDVLSFITVVFKTGAAALAFLSVLRQEMKARKAVVAVADSATGAARGKLSGDTADSVLQQMVR